jgi:hypothetical protein
MRCARYLDAEFHGEQLGTYRHCNIPAKCTQRRHSGVNPDWVCESNHRSNAADAGVIANGHLLELLKGVQRGHDVVRACICVRARSRSARFVVGEVDDIEVAMPLSAAVGDCHVRDAISATTHHLYV